jgi:hypothetical protein
MSQNCDSPIEIGFCGMRQLHETTGFWKHNPKLPKPTWLGSCSCGTTWETNERVQGCPKETV